MYLFAVQMGAGGFSVSLPRWRRGGRLFVSRQPDQGRRPGLQQRGQLHVTRQPTYNQVTDCQVAIRSDHCTSTQHKAHRQWRSDFAQQLCYCRHCLNTSLKLFKADVHFAHSDQGKLGRFYWLEMQSDKSEVFSDKMTHSRHSSWLLLVLFAISDVIFCTVCWLPCHTFDFLLKGS